MDPWLLSFVKAGRPERGYDLVPGVGNSLGLGPLWTGHCMGLSRKGHCRDKPWTWAWAGSISAHLSKPE